MKVFKFFMPTEDVDIIKENIGRFKKLFREFELLSDHLVVEDDTLAEYGDGCDMFSLKEVELKFSDNINHFWTLAKMVEKIKNKSHYDDEL